MRVIISIILMVIAALVGFFFGAGMNEAMGGAILLSMITGFACTINAIETVSYTHLIMEYAYELPKTNMVMETIRLEIL